MRKLLSIVLALTLVLGMLPVFADQVFDVENTGAKNLKHYGFIGGDENGNLKENEVLTREQLAIVLATLHGKFEQAKAFEAATGYADESEFPAWSKNFISYAKAQGWLVGNDKNMFDNKGVVSAEMLASVFLRILGHVTAEKPVEWGKNVETLKEKTEIEVRGNALTRGEAFEAMWIAVSTPVMSEKGKVLGVELGKLVFDKFDVTEIKATSTKEIKVTFSKALSEEERKNIEVTVLRGKTTVDVTSKWLASNDAIVLTNKTNFPHSEFDVVVKYEKADLKSEKITFTQQKISKIQFLSDAVAVDPKNGNGYVVYKVFDQYENDITDTYLSAQIRFEVASAVSHDNGKKGILTLSPKKTTVPGQVAQSLLTFQMIPIIAYETNSGINVSVSLPTTTKLGSISDFQFGDPKDIKLVDGDLASVFYLPYEAIDQAGGATKSYELVKNGLILTGDSQLITSLGNVVARVAQDPKDASKAVIELRVKGANNFNMDMPVTITAMTYTGKTSTVNLTLTKARELDSFILLAPSKVVAVGDENVEIPFEAFDQYGNKITRYSELFGKVALAGSLNPQLDKNAQGQAILRLKTKPTTEGPVFITATVNKTAKFSQLQLQVQKEAGIERLVLNDSGATFAIEKGASKAFRFDPNPARGFYIADQYGRKIDLKGNQALLLKVKDNNIMDISGNSTKQHNHPILKGYGSFSAVSSYTGTDKEQLTTVEIVLIKNWDTTSDKILAEDNIIDKKTVNLISVPTNLIVRYEFYGDEVAYANAKDLFATTPREQEYAVGGGATGVTINNITNVKLFNAKYKVIVENTAEFALLEDGLSVVAAKPLYGKSESTTKYTISVEHGKNYDSKTFTLKGSTEVPVAKAVRYSGTSTKTEDNVVKVKLSDMNALHNKVLQAYNQDGTAPSGAYSNATAVRFMGIDQYGTTALNLSFTMVKLSGTGAFSVSAEGVVTKTTDAVVGDTFLLTATAANGLSETVQLEVISD